MSADTGFELDYADDRTLVGRAADGDTRAFAAIMRRNGPAMRAYARKLLGSSDELDDVVQEAFIAAWKQLPELHDPNALKSWLMRTVSHKSIDRIRARRDHDDLDDHELASASELEPEVVSASRSRDGELARVLSSLPEQQRQCWVLKEMGGYSYDEIAHSLNVPTSTIRGLLARARKTVMRDMEAWR